MVEMTTARCFVLWLLNFKDKPSAEPTIFTSAHAAITEGERLKDKGVIKDYNYSVVFCPQIGGEQVKTKVLTDITTEPSIQL